MRPSSSLAPVAMLAIALSAVAQQDPASITIEPAAPTSAGALGEDCATACFIDSLPYSDTGTTLGRINDYDEFCVNNSPAPDVVYQYTSPTDAIIDISMCANTAYDSFLYVYEDTCGTPIACNDDACATPSFPSALVAAIFDLQIRAGHTYYIVVDGYNTESGPYTLDIFPVSRDDATVTCTGASAFAQPPDPPQSNWQLAFSDAIWQGTGAIVRYEDYHLPATSNLTRLVFWGAPYDFNGAAQCFDNPMLFDIVVLDDAGGAPGAPIDVIPDIPLYPTPTPYNYPLSFQAQRYELDFAALPGGPPTIPADGWVSIVGKGGDPDCWFGWLSSGGPSNGTSYLDEAGLVLTAPFDLSMCLEGTPAPCPGDANGNGAVEVDDITFVIFRLGNLCP